MLFLFTLFCACALVTSELFPKFITIDLDGDLGLFNRVRPEVDNSCYITRVTDEPFLYVICPTEVDCCVKPGYSEMRERLLKPSSNRTLSDHCRTMTGEPLPVKKKQQLNAVLGFFGVSEESACAFSSIETLSASDHFLFESLRLDRDNCLSDCPPLKLRDLRLVYSNIERLSNHTFCQLGQLEYFRLSKSRVRFVDKDAFVHLVNVKEMVLKQNYLTDLPVNVFRNNVCLRSLDLSENWLLSSALRALSSVEALKRLDLSDNRIDFSTSHVTFPSGLERLFIRNNKLQRLTLELKNLSQLVELQMGNSSVTKVDQNAFRDLRSIRLINLEQNGIELLAKDTFLNTSQLEEVNFSGNRLTDFPPVGHLVTLKRLYVSNNRISSINRTDLLNCSRLSILDLSYNELNFIEEATFQNVWHLERLILDHNRLSEWSADFGSSNVSELGLSYNHFATFSFRKVPRFAWKLNMSFNNITTIEAFDFSGQTWNLTHLDLSHNRIVSVKNLTLPRSIQEVDLSSNRVREAYGLRDLNERKLLDLRVINLRENQIEFLCPKSFPEHKPATAILYYMSDNPLRCHGELSWVKANFDLATLDETYCQSVMPNNDTLVQLSLMTDSDTLFHSDHMDSRRCRCPHDYVDCDFPCPYNCTCLSDLNFWTVHLICSQGQFTQVPKDLKLRKVYDFTLINVEFSGNFIPHVGPLDFGDYTNDRITSLRLPNCHIVSIDSHAFDKLAKLMSLSLTSNRLEVLPEGLFHNLNELDALDLSNNRLIHLADNAFSFLVNLKRLYLHGNRLTKIEVYQWTSLENISLHDNPWSCDCAFIKPFRDFLLNSPKKVYDKLPLNCTENGKQFDIPSFKVDHCWNQIQLTVLITSLTFAIVLIVVAGLVFKWRYELQVLVYSRYGLRMFHKRQPEEDARGKQYDAFMAYNSKDEDFLAEQLLPGLEGIENPYKILIHERDFLAGGFIQDNILEAIKISSRTIIVLTENFVNSGWCRFEFKTAHAQMMEDRCPRLLVIVVGDVPKTVDPEMQLYLKTNTYLKWGERLFWEKLYFAMPDRRVTTPPTNVTRDMR